MFFPIPFKHVVDYFIPVEPGKIEDLVDQPLKLFGLPIDHGDELFDVIAQAGGDNFELVDPFLDRGERRIKLVRNDG